MIASNTGGIIIAGYPAAHPDKQVWHGIWLAFSGKNGSTSELLKRFYPNAEAAQALISGGSIICLDKSPENISKYGRFFAPIPGSSPEKLIELMNKEHDSIFAFIHDGQNWQTRDIASHWTF